jgi:hypothetical protein
LLRSGDASAERTLYGMREDARFVLRSRRIGQVDFAVRSREFARTIKRAFPLDLHRSADTFRLPRMNGEQREKAD